MWSNHKRIFCHLKQFIFIVFEVGFIFFCAACQATPEEAVVQSKTGEEFEEAIQKTAEEVKSETTEVQHITKMITNDTKTTTIEVDADVILPQVNKIPVAEVGKGRISQEQLDRVIDTLIGDGEMYDPSIVTREKLEAKIVRIKKEALDMDSDLAQSNFITNMTDLQAYADERIKEIQEQMADAPSETEIDPTITNLAVSTNSASIYVDDGKEYDAWIRYWNTLDSAEPGWGKSQGFEYINYGKINCDRRLDPRYADEIDEPADETEAYKNALMAVTTLMEKMQMPDIILSHSFITSDPSDLSNGESGERIYYPDKEYYVFIYSRTLNDVPIASAFYSGGKLTEEEHKLKDKEAADFSDRISNEIIEVWLDGDDVVQFFWKMPLGIESIINDNVQISVGVEEAVEAMAKNLMLTYNKQRYGADAAVDIVIDIDRIELNLACLKVKNKAEEYIISPVWDFYGMVKVQYTEKHMDDYFSTYPDIFFAGDNYIYDNLLDFKSLCTVNALDGTIIDRGLGY